MLVRVTGGNSGIKDYLENGRKQDRHFSREELDRREPIHGDLQLTDAVIDSIPDKGQERYLHITMSFKEKDISSERIKPAVHDFVETAMAAYSNEEFNYYAEIHHPRLKSIYNTQTDNMDDRLTHVHIVIPKRNLLSSTRLNPLGKHMQNVDFIDAIQEKVNADYSFESPKYNPRYNLHNKREALGKYTRELTAKSGPGSGVKVKAAAIADGATYDEFKKRLSDQGEIKVRNSGKDNEYLAVKFKGEEKFTNLREPIFKRTFLDEGKLEFEKLSEKVIKERVQDWKDRRSKEIKYIFDASKPIRNDYKNLAGKDRIEYLKQREQYFYSRHDQTQEVTSDEQYSLTGEEDYQRSHSSAGRGRKPPRAERVHSLQGMHERSLVHQQGRTLLLLQGNAHPHVHTESGGTDNAPRLRRPAYGADGISSNIQELASQGKHRPATPSDFNTIDAERLIDYCHKTYLINPSEHAITKNKKGEYRISAGSRNLSNSDFLTKHIGLDWPTARQVLETLDRDEKNRTPIESVTNDELKSQWRDFSNDHKSRYQKLKSAEKQLSHDFRKQRKEILDAYRLERLTIKATKTPQSRRVFLESVAVYNKMVKLEALKEERQNSIRELRNSIRPFHRNISSKGDDMKHLDALKAKFSAKDSAWTSQEEDFEKATNAIRSGKHSVDASPQDTVKRALRNARESVKSESASKIKIHDLLPVETKNGTDFKHKTTNETVFRDNGKYMSFDTKLTERGKIEVGLDYALNRYGTNLDIRGTKDFKAAVVEVAAEKNLNVTFSDNNMNKQLADLKAEMGHASRAGEQATAATVSGSQGKQEGQSRPVDTSKLGPWDNVHADEDGITNAQHSALHAGSSMKELPKEARDTPGLITAYIHGLKSVGVEDSAEIDQVASLSKNAEKHLNDLGYKLKSDNLSTSHEPLVSQSDIDHQVAKEAGRSLEKIPQSIENDDKLLNSYIEGAKETKEYHTVNAVSISYDAAFNEKDPLKALEQDSEIKDPLKAIEQQDSFEKVATADSRIAEAQQRIATLQAAKNSSQDYGME